MSRLRAKCPRALAFGRALMMALVIGKPAAALDVRSAGDSEQRDIRVQVVAQTSTVIGAPMAGRLSQFPLHDGDQFAQGQVLARFVCGEREGALAHARALLEGKRHVLESKQKLHSLGTSSEMEYAIAVAEAQEASADVVTAQAMAESCTVTAPFAGRVAAVSAHNYQFVGLGAPLLEILSDKDLELEFIVPSRWLTWLVPGAAFDVAIDETGRTYPAKVTQFSGKVDPVSRSIKVYAQVVQGAAGLLPGMTGRALLNPPADGSAVSAK